MSKVAAMLFVLALAACGGGQDGAGSAEGEADVGSPPVSASAQRCLDLVAGAQWTAAVPACTEALQELPDSAEVQDALARARAEAARLSEAAAEAAEETAEEAATAVEDAAEALTGEDAP